MSMQDARPTMVALIPARAGSKRLSEKNIRLLAGHPLIAYTIAAARTSGVFDAVILSTDSQKYADIGAHYGAEVPFLRPSEFAGDTSSDIEWVAHALAELDGRGRRFDCFSILRPTSPFRRAETIQRAAARFLATSGVDSLRAVEKVEQHPGKMWVVRGQRMTPLLPITPEVQPWHSMQYQALPEVYVQNASLEMAWTRVVHDTGTIAGYTLIPFFTSESEGVDVNTIKDWWYAERLLADGKVNLPEVSQASYSKT